MVDLLQPGLWGGSAVGSRWDASFSHGDRWKRLISRYIQAMASIGSMLEPEKQRAIGGASAAAIHAMSAKVGEAASPSQLAASRARGAGALPFREAAEVVIFGLPIDIRRFQPLQNRPQVYGERSGGRE